MRKKFGVSTVVEYLLLFLLAVLFIFPLVWMIVSSMKLEGDIARNLTNFKAFLPSINPAEWFKSYSEVLSRFSIPMYIANSIFYAVVVSACSILVNGMAAYAFAKINFKGKKILFGFLLALLIVPAETILIPKFTVVHALDIVNTRLGVILPAVANVFCIYLFRNFFIAVPDEIIESARIDGAGTFRIFWKIMLPMSKPAVATVGTLSFIWNWNDYLWPLMVLTDKTKFSIQVAITAIQTTEPVYTNQVMAVLTMATIPLIIVYIVAQKYILQGLGGSGSGIK